MENFLQVYVPLADSWKVWDNEGGVFKLLADSDGLSYDELVTLLTNMSLKEDQPRKMSPSTERALRAGQLAYEDAKAENARWGLPMIPQEWDPRIEPVYTGKKKVTSPSINTSSEA